MNEIQSLYRYVLPILLMLSGVGALEIYNHLTCGDEIRPWVMGNEEYSRAKIKEVLVQGQEQTLANYKHIDAIAEAQEAKSERDFNKPINKKEKRNG